MQWRERMRVDRDGVRIAVDVAAAINVNRGEVEADSQARSVSHVRVVQDSRRAGQQPGRAGESEDKRKERT